MQLPGDSGTGISLAGELIRSHTANHDPITEDGAFAAPRGRLRIQEALKFCAAQA